MMWTVNKVSKMTGVSARTLHHYDKIGLLKPSAVTEVKVLEKTDECKKTTPR